MKDDDDNLEEGKGKDCEVRRGERVQALDLWEREGRWRREGRGQ